MSSTESRDRPADPIGSWLLLPPDNLPTIRRASGALLIFVLPEVVFWSHGGPGPYHVPAWHLGGSPIDLPLPPPWLDATLWAAYLGAALALILGNRHAAAPAIAATVLAYYGWRDVRACNSSYVQLLFTYLIALLFARETACCSRRLIQCSLTSCYAFSVVQKLAMPGWRGGETLLEILEQAEGVRPACVPLLRALSPGPDLVPVLAPGVIALEALIGAGLWWARTRKPAMIAGLGLHLGFAVAFPGTEIFAPVMFTGYLAFLEGGTPAFPSDRPRRFEIPLALAFLGIMLAFPARIYLPPMRAWHLLSHMDHLPWTYSMFSQFDRVESVAVAYFDRRGMSHQIRPVGRMLQATSDAELFALARDVLLRQPEAQRVSVEVRLTVNSRRILTKLVESSRGGLATIRVVQTP